MTHPYMLGDDAIEEFLTRLATRRNASAITQNQALTDLLFLHKEILDRPSEHLSFTRARSSRRLPVVLSGHKVNAVLQSVDRRPGRCKRDAEIPVFDIARFHSPRTKDLR
jgi:hypothetical protein